MANGTGEQIFEETPVTAPDGSIIPVRHPKGASERDIKAFAAQEYYKTHPKPAQPAAIGEPGGELDVTDVAAQVDPLEFARAVPRGMVRGAAGTASFLGAMGRGEIEAASAPFGGPRDLPPAATTEQLTEPIAAAIERATGGYIPMEKPTTPSGEAGERVGEFLGDPVSWLGPGGRVLKTGQAIAGGIGSYIGEKIGGEYGHPALGALAGGGIGGGVTGMVTPRGLTPRPPRGVRAATTEEGVYQSSKAGYRDLSMLNYEMDVAQAGQIRRAIIDDLTLRNPAEPDRMVILEDQAGDVFRHLDLLLKPSSVPNKITVNEVERVRQVLQTDRMNKRVSAPAEAEAAGRAIGVIDEFLEALPGVKGLTEQARGNWSAYKRGQLVEETLRRSLDRAGTSGTGFNLDNAIRQEFRNRIRNKPIWDRFTKREQQEIELIMNPGKAANFLGRYVSRFGPQHILTGTIATGGGMFALTHSPTEVLAVLAAGATGHQLSKHLAHGRAERLSEITRARSPAGGGYEPGPLLSRPQMGGVGAARALGATALSPDTTERLELPEITVRPPQ